MDKLLTRLALDILALWDLNYGSTERIPDVGVLMEAGSFPLIATFLHAVRLRFETTSIAMQKTSQTQLWGL